MNKTEIELELDNRRYEYIMAWHNSDKEQPKQGTNVVVWNGSSGEILTNVVNVNTGRIWAYLDELLYTKGDYYKALRKSYDEGYEDAKAETLTGKALNGKSTAYLRDETLSKHLDKAATKYAFGLYDEDSRVYYYVENAFKAGALWHEALNKNLTDLKE
jgi:hypothetical protein